MAQYTHGIWGSSISAAQWSNLDLEARANALAAIRNEEPPGGSETSAATASRSTNPMEIDEDDEDGEHDEDDNGGNTRPRVKAPVWISTTSTYRQQLNFKSLLQ
jgi:hypothetical protein